MSWSAAILAGGQARRLGGQNKSTLDVGGVCMLDRQLAALESLTGDVVIIGGPSPHPHAPRLRVVPDQRPGTGALGGLYTALSVAATDRVLVLACDMPFVNTSLLERLIRADPAALAVIPATGGRWHPLCAIYAHRAADGVGRALDNGIRRVTEAVARLSPRLLTDDQLSSLGDTRLFDNVNTPDEYARARKYATLLSAANRTARP
jgi:molybdopterin-guanine dinucleotide biosynthesis protein A